MKFNKKILIIIFTFFTIIGCQSNVKKEKLVSEKRFGFWKSRDSVSTELEVKKFKNWHELIERIDQIVCNDSLPKLTLQNKNSTKIIYFQNPCWNKFGCILIRSNNVIEIHNDSIIKSHTTYPLDSLYNVLKRDIENNGKKTNLCQSPKKLLISISYSDKFENLPRVLDKLTDAYSKITNKTNIKIWLKTKVVIIPPPADLYQN